MVSNVALLAGLVVLYRLTELELGDAVARRTVLLLCVFPTAFFLFAPYTESLFLALSVGCLYAARRRSWLLAGYLGALASATRSTGVLLAAALAVEGLLQARERRSWRALTVPAVAVLAVPLGLLSYLAYWHRLGQWDRPLELQATNWRKVSAWPWETLQAAWSAGVDGLAVADRSFRTVDLVLVLVMLVAGAAVSRRVRPSYVVYFWLSALLPLTLMDPDRPLQSVPRYYLVLPPVFWGLALLARRDAVREVLVPVLALGLGALSLLFVTLVPGVLSSAHGADERQADVDRALAPVGRVHAVVDAHRPGVRALLRRQQRGGRALLDAGRRAQAVPLEPRGGALAGAAGDDGAGRVSQRGGPRRAAAQLAEHDDRLRGAHRGAGDGPPC